MKKILTTALCVAALTFAGSSFANSQYDHAQGPHQGRGHFAGMFCGSGENGNMPRGFDQEIAFTTVKDIQKNAKEDDRVRLKGKLVKYLGDEKFEFVDANNDSIIVELDNDRNWSHLAKDMPIEIIAKVDDEKVAKFLDVKCARPDFSDKFFKDRRNAPRGFEGNADTKDAN